MLADMTTRERKAIPVMPPGREDVIPAGATILVRAMRRWGFEQATLSESDILDGLALRMVEDGLPELEEVEAPSRAWAPRRVFGG
jgi:exopolyphosphatase/guanosine-5'-triphosphate,3'-diphosphate pyrophosphatase